MSSSRDEYESKLDAASSAHRLDPLRDAAHEVVMAWMAEDDLEKQDLSDRFFAAMSRLAGVLVSVKRGDVPDVEVTYDRSPVPVEPNESRLERRRSAAKNLSDPIYQNAFIEGARAAMGQPDVEAAKEFLGRDVKLTFNVDWHPAMGKLTEVKDDSAATAYLILDNYRERLYPLNSIQSIEVR